MKETGFNHEGKIVTFSSLPESEKSLLKKFAYGGMPPRSMRKALYSALVEAGAGNEIIALIFGHGANALLAMGPLAFYPLSWVFRTARYFLEKVHEEAGIPALFQEMLQKRRQYPPPEPITPAEVTKKREMAECALLPGIAMLAIATQQEIELVDEATDKFIKQINNNEDMSDDSLRSGLLLLLARAGVPGKNLIRHRKYYEIDSFTSASGPLYFVAVMPQADVGLGLIPITMGDLSDVVKKILERLKATGRKELFYDRRIEIWEMGLFIGTLLKPREHGYPYRFFRRAWIRVSNFNALWELGGMLAAGLASKLILPANYYDIGDLLNAENKIWHPLLNHGGEPWKNPYLPTKEEQADNLSVSTMTKLLQKKTIRRPGKKGRPRKLDSKFESLSAESSSDELADFIGRYHCLPTRKKIITFLVNTFKMPNALAKKKASEIFTKLRRSGHLHAGQPLRYLPLELLPEFLDRLVIAIRSESKKASAELIKPSELWIWGGAALAMRISETLRMSSDDHQKIGNFETMYINGTKTWRAERDFPLDLARTGLSGERLVSRLLEVLPQANAHCPSDDAPAISAQRASSFLAPIMDKTFRELRGIPDECFTGNRQIDGRFTHHGLRHAGAIRMIQGIMDTCFISGDLWAGVSELSLSMGQSLHTHLCSYVGTAARVLKYPVMHRDSPQDTEDTF